MPKNFYNNKTALVAGLTVEDATKSTEILGRLKLASNTKSDTDLARALGLKQSSISTAKTRGMIPSAWIVNAARLFNVSTDWLIFGERLKPEGPIHASFLQNYNEDGPPLRPVERTPATTKDYESLGGPEFDKIWDEFRMESTAKRGWVQIEILKRFPEFAEWLESNPRLVKFGKPEAISLNGVIYPIAKDGENTDDSAIKIVTPESKPLNKSESE